MFLWSFKTVYFSSLLAVAFSRFKNSQSKSHSIHTLPDLPSTPWTVQKKIVLEDQKADSNFLALAELQSDKETEGWKTGQPESEKVTRESEREGDDGCHALTLTSRQPSVTTTDRSYWTHTHTHKHTHTHSLIPLSSLEETKCVWDKHPGQNTLWDLCRKRQAVPVEPVSMNQPFSHCMYYEYDLIF